MPVPDLVEPLAELVRRTSTDLPADVEKALREAREREDAGSPAQSALDTILENVALARRTSSPVCQDTGTPIFHVHYPTGWSQATLREQIRKGLALATERAYMRPNAVDSLTGKNSGNNLGIDFPTIHFEEWDKDFLKVDLLLKGGGSENCGAQYSLPDDTLNAGRDLAGVRKAVLDAVWRAQGQGCAPGVMGVAIGGDRGSSFLKSKEQLQRKLDDANPDPELAKFEQKLTEEANSLGIGPMGFGGKTTVMGVKVGALHRLPASFFVSVSYMCWADRRRSMIVRNGEVTYE